MWTDLRPAIRQLRLTPGFTAVVAVVLALGIGINVAAFGALDALFFRDPAGVRAPGEVRRLTVAMPPTPGQQVFFNEGYGLADVAALRARRGTFAALGAYAGGGASLTDSAGATPAGEPRKLAVTLVGAGYFETLGVRPARGRAFTRRGVRRVRRGAGRRRHATASGGTRSAPTRPPSGARSGSTAAPSPSSGSRRPASAACGSSGGRPVPPARHGRHDRLPGRLRATPTRSGCRPSCGSRPASTSRAAESVGTTVLRAADAANGGPAVGFDARRPRSVRATPLHDGFGRRASEGTSPLPPWLIGATAAVLLVVCANVANLLVARAERRRREMATRVALGAHRGRLVRQLLAEGLALAASGGALGVGVAIVGTRLLRLVPDMPPVERFVDGRALAFAAAVTLLTTLGFALVPAVHAARSDAGELLRAGVRGTARAAPVRTALLAVQFAASLALLGVGGLFVRSLRNAQGVDVGFPRERTLVASADWEAFGITGREASGIVERASARVRALPAVRGAASATFAPFDGVSMSTLRVPGRADLSAISGVPGGMFFTNAVDTAYFGAIGIPIVRGRAFEARDAAGAGAVVVNETFARRVWPGEEPVGKCVHTQFGDDAPCVTVVGVARDARFLSLTDELAPLFYTPLARQTSGPTQLLVQLRPGTSPAERRATTIAVRAAVTSEDPRLTFATVEPLGERMIGSMLLPYRVSAAAFSVFGALALLLAAVGLYGVVAYAVAQRAGEFGLRVALGARARDIAALVLRQGLRLTAAGAVVGIAAAVGVARLLQSRLYGVRPIDVPTLGAVALVLALTALLACWLPARRAARVDPADALRAD